MTSILELTDWLDKQRRAYHKHDGFPEHPVRVLHHQEYFAGDHETPESKPQPAKDISLSNLSTWKEKPTNSSVAFGGVIFNANGEILLRKPTGNFGGYSWTYAKGRPNEKETPEQTALREVVEETGIQGKILREIPGYFTGTTTDNKFFIMAVENDTGEYHWETEEVGWFSPDEARERIGETIDDLGRQRDLDILDSLVSTELTSPNWDSVLERSGPQLGSNPGGIFSDKNTGKRFYLKYGNDEQNSVEHLANTLYRELGVTVPNMEIIDFQGDRALKSEWLEGAKADSSGKSHMESDEVRDNFAIDAWLANWDVAGMGHDNIVEHDGKMYRIDTGGALYKRARGGDKQSFYNSEVSEIDTLRDSQMNPSSARVFSRVTDEDIRYGVGLLAEIDNDRINELVQQSHLPDEEKDRVANALIARKQNLLARFGVIPIDKSWLGKQRRAYHKHDGFPEHPVRVKHHQEYFASHVGETNQPSSDVPKQDFSTIYSDLETLILNTRMEDPFSIEEPLFSHYAEDIQRYLNSYPRMSREGLQLFKERIRIILDESLSDDDFVRLLQRLSNSHTPNLDLLEEELNRYRSLIVPMSEEEVTEYLNSLEYDEKRDDGKLTERDKILRKFESLKYAVNSIATQEQFFAEVVIATRPVSLLQDNIDTLINSDKWFVKDTVPSLLRVDPTADFLMDIANNKDVSFEIRTEAILSLDAKRFDEFMTEGLGDQWMTSGDEKSIDAMGEGFYEFFLTSRFQSKLNTIRVLHEAFGGREVVNYFIDNLEFPEDVNFNLEDTFSVQKVNPGFAARQAFTSLYKQTKFKYIHESSMEDWETSSSSDWGGLLKESVGRLMDGYTVYHQGGIHKIPLVQNIKFSTDRRTIIEDYKPDVVARKGHTFTSDLYPNYTTSQDFLDEYVLTHKKAIRKVLDAVYKDQDYIPIYRGTSGGAEIIEIEGESTGYVPPSQYRHPDIGDDWIDVGINANPLSSYTINTQTAAQFADDNSGWLISSLVHKDDVWSNFWAHSYNGNEREFLIVNKERETVGIPANKWKRLTLENRRSPISKNYSSFGFLGEEDSIDFISPTQQKKVDKLFADLKSPNIPGSDTPWIVEGHLTNLHKVYIQLNDFISEENMPWKTVFDIWNEGLEDAGWKKNPDMENNEHIKRRVAVLTQKLKRSAGIYQVKKDNVQKSEWLGKQRRAYHKHDGFPEHPVRVKHHQEYFASHVGEPNQVSDDVPKQDISDIHSDITTLLIDFFHEKEKLGAIPYGDSKYIENWIEGDFRSLTENDYISEKYLGTVADKLDELFSDEDFAQLLQGLENSHSPERKALEAERDKLREILDKHSRDFQDPEIRQRHDDIVNRIRDISEQEHFIKDVVLGTRPIPLLMDNIDTLVNSDKWYMQEIASDLMNVDPTADFLMDIFNNESINFDIRTEALLALDAKRFDEVMSERYGRDWKDIDDWSEDMQFIDYLRMFNQKHNELKRLHNAFGRDAVNHFIEHLEFPDDVQFDLEDTFNVMKKDPGKKARDLFIELYRNTKFGHLHETSMEQWEASSSSDWGGLLKESIGRQLDGDIVHHSGLNISRLQEMYFPSRPQRLIDFVGWVSPDSGPNIYGDIVHHDDADSSKYITSQELLDKYVLTHKKAIRKILDSVYKDQDYIPVYRGTGIGGEVEETTELKDFKLDEWNPIAVTANPLSSYSLDASVAHKFARRESGWIISSLVHKDDVWSNFWAHSYAGNEREFLLINKERESMGILAGTWTEVGKRISPLTSDYNNYGFQEIGHNQYFLDDEQKNTVLDASLNIKSTYNLDTPQVKLSVNEHMDNLSEMSSYLEEWMNDNGMPASMALEIWNDAIKDAGWKKNSELQNDPEFLSLPNYMKDLTEALEKKAAKEISSSKESQTIPEANASQKIEGKDYSIKDAIDDFLIADIPGAKENSLNPNWYAENFVDEYDFAKKWTDKLIEDGEMFLYTSEEQQKTGLVDEDGNPIMGTIEDQLNEHVDATVESYGKPIWAWVQQNLTNEEWAKADKILEGLEKSQLISKQASTASTARTMLVPYRTMVHRPAKTPYFATRWKRVTVPQRTGTAYNVIPVGEYKGNIQDIYSSWKGYVGDREEGRHDLYLPIIALQEIIYKGFDGLLATFNNRIVGVVSLSINQVKEARLSILSASPFDIIQGTENRIEDMLRRGVEIYVKNKGWDYIGIDGDAGDDGEDIDLEKARGQLIPVKVPITLPSGKKTEAIRWKKGKSDPKAFADFDDVFEALGDNPKMKTYLESVVNKIPATWNRNTLELDMSSDSNVIARAINSFGKWSYIRSTEKDGEIEKAKHSKVEKFSKAITQIRKGIARGLKKGDEEAIILHLIDVAGLRIGDEPDSGEADDHTQPKDEDGKFKRVPTYAARQLLGKHVSVNGTKIRLQYPAKDNVPLDKTIDNAVLAKFFSNKKKKAGDDDKLFESSASKVRGYFKKLSGGNDFHVHFFRHYHATRLIIDRLKDYPMPTVDSEEISKAIRRAEIKQFKSGGRKKLSQSDRKVIVADYVAKQFRKHQLEVAKTSAEFLIHTPEVSIKDYIMPAVWSEWDKEQGKIVREHLSNPEPEPKKVRTIKRTPVTKQDDYNPDEYQPWEDIDDFFERTMYDEGSIIDDDSDIFPEDKEEREAQEKEDLESDEGWQYPIELSKSTASITEAKRRGLIPQSGDWLKPKRWVRPKYADAPVEEKTELIKLPEDTWKYFNKVPNTILVDVSKLSPSKDINDQINRKPIEKANRFMELAYRGENDKRNPIDLKDNGDGTYTILDGNSTYANAVDSEWKKLPGVVVEKPRKKATIRSSKRMTVIDGDVEETLKDIFHEDFKPSDFQDMYSTGLEEFSTEIIAIRTHTTPNPRNTRKGISIHIAIHLKERKDGPLKEVGKMFRTFSKNDKGRIIATHQSFVLNPIAQNQGVASDLLENVEEEYKKHGVWGIGLTANADIGGYAWARQGYDFTNDKDRENIRNHFKKFVTTMLKNGKIWNKDITPFLEAIDSFEHSWEFASWNPLNEPHGKHLGKTIMLGRSWGAGKRLHMDSQGYQRGKIYFALKRKHNEQG